LNPGPVTNQTQLNLVSFNMNGSLRNASKQKRLLNKLHKINCLIACLQETHLVERDEFCLKARWAHNVVTSNLTNASAGVAILYRENDWDVVHGYGSLIEGRCCYLAAEKSKFKVLIFNVYAPNSPVNSHNFYEDLKSKIENISAQYLDHEICMCGDFNLSLSKKDNINRIENSAFDSSIETIHNIFSTYNLLDSRTINSDACMPSWRRLKTASKLDYIYISAQWFNYLEKYDHDWAFEQSDHCAITAQFKIPSEICIGRGYFKINMQLMENKEYLTEITNHINEIEHKLVNTWNPHQVWEYYKLEIRNIFLKLGSNSSSIHKRDLSDTEKELDSVIKGYNSKLKNTNASKISEKTYLESIELLENRLGLLRKIEADKLLFRSKLKYINEGEKCTKYF